MPQVKSELSVLPPALQEVALVDVKVCAAARGISKSQWYELVSKGQAPQPVLRLPRCTRWRLADVKAHLLELARQQDSKVADAVAVRAIKASRAAAAKRSAAAAAAK